MLFSLGKARNTSKPIINNGIIEKILTLALPVKVVVKDINSGPMIAANLPNML